MRVGIATDQVGFGLKEELVAQLRAAGHEVIDFGANTLAVATENRIRDGADAAMGYPRFAMLDLLKLLSGLLVGLFRSHAAREAETAFLRQQLVVLKRSAPARLRLRPADRLIFVLALEVAPSCRSARGPGRHPRFDPNNQPRQPAVGCATDSRRAAETWHRHRAVDGRQVHVTASPPSLSGLASFPAQSHCPHRRRRSVRRSDERVQTALWAGHPGSGAATARLDQCDSKSNRRVDRPADLRSIPMG